MNTWLKLAWRRLIEFLNGRADTEKARAELHKEESGIMSARLQREINEHVQTKLQLKETEELLASAKSRLITESAARPKRGGALDPQSEEILKLLADGSERPTFFLAEKMQITEPKARAICEALEDPEMYIHSDQIYGDWRISQKGRSYLHLRGLL